MHLSSEQLPCWSLTAVVARELICQVAQHFSLPLASFGRQHWIARLSLVGLTHVGAELLDHLLQRPQVTVGGGDVIFFFFSAPTPSFFFFHSPNSYGVFLYGSQDLTGNLASLLPQSWLRWDGGTLSACGDGMTECSRKSILVSFLNMLCSHYSTLWNLKSFYLAAYKLRDVFPIQRLAL